MRVRKVSAACDAQSSQLIPAMENATEVSIGPTTVRESSVSLTGVGFTASALEAESDVWQPENSAIGATNVMPRDHRVVSTFFAINRRFCSMQAH